MVQVTDSPTDRKQSFFEKQLRKSIEYFDRELMPVGATRGFLQSWFILDRAAKGEEFSADQIFSAMYGDSRFFLAPAVNRYIESLDSTRLLDAMMLRQIVPDMTKRGARKLLDELLRTTLDPGREKEAQIACHASVLKSLAGAKLLQDGDFLNVMEHVSWMTRSSEAKPERGNIPWDTDNIYVDVAKKLIDKILLNQTTVDQFVESINASTTQGTELVEALAAREYLSPSNMASIIRQSLFFNDVNGLKTFLVLQDYNATLGRDRQVDLVEIAKSIPDVSFDLGGKTGLEALEILALQRRAGIIKYEEFVSRLNGSEFEGMSAKKIIGLVATIDDEVCAEMKSNGFGEKDLSRNETVGAASNRPIGDVTKGIVPEIVPPTVGDLQPPSPDLDR